MAVGARAKGRRIRRTQRGPDLSGCVRASSRPPAAAAAPVAIIQQANIFPAFAPFPGDPKQEPNGFTELRNAVSKEAAAFGKPVVLVHGDSHYFRVDTFMRRRAGSDELVVENVTRVEPFGSPFHHWVMATVDPDDPNVFTFHQRLVPANMVQGK